MRMICKTVYTCYPYIYLQIADRCLSCANECNDTLSKRTRQSLQPQYQKVKPVFRSQRRNLIYGTSKAKRPPCCWFGGTQSFGHFFLVEKIPNNFHGFLSFQLFTYQLSWSHHESIINLYSLMSMKLIYNFAILAKEFIIGQILFFSCFRRIYGSKYKQNK